MSGDIICVTAGQRSGTNAFRKALSNTGRAHDVGEIFNTATLGWPGNYFAYCRERTVGMADILSGQDAEDLCKDYIASLRELAGEAHLLFDVKFNSWGQIRAPWSYLHQEPYFLGHLKNHEAKIVFIWRRDMVAQIISDRIGAAIGKWHNIKAEDVREPVTLDVEENRTLAELMCQSELYFWNNLKTYPRTLLLCYEELFVDGVLSNDSQMKVSEFIGEPLQFIDRNYYRRNEILQREVVVNYDEVAAAVADAVAKGRKDFMAERG